LLGGTGIPIKLPFGGSMVFMGLFGSIMLSVFYTVITVILVVLYNAISSFFGGIEIDFEATELESMHKRLDALHSDVRDLQEASKQAEVIPETEPEDITEEKFEEKPPDEPPEEPDNSRFMPK